MQFIAQNLRKIYATIKLAEALNQNELHKIVEKLQAILKEPKNFTPTPEDPLVFSPEGQKKVLLDLGYNSRIVKNVHNVLKILINAITLAGNTGNPEMKRLEKALDKPGKWESLTSINGMNWEHAKLKITRSLDTIEDLYHQSARPGLTLENVQEMQDRNLISK